MMCLVVVAVIGIHQSILVHSLSDDVIFDSFDLEEAAAGRVFDDAVEDDDDDASSISPQQQLNADDVSPIISKENRIVGGTQANRGDHKWFVQGYGCGGSLIWFDIVLSAGT